MSNYGSYGVIKINSTEFKVKPPPKIDTRTVPPIIPSVSRPKPVVPDRNASFDIEVNYKDYKLVVRQRGIAQTNLILEISRNYRRYVNKNVLKDVKEFVSTFAGKKQAHNLRKRIIALEKFGKIEEKRFKFLIEE
jgi:hypothetical protein